MEKSKEKEIAVSARSMMRAGQSDAEIEQRTGIDPMRLLELRAAAAAAPLRAFRFGGQLPESRQARE
jgi:hypothetical protein